MVKIIWIAFVLVLKLMEEVEDVKGKCRCRSVKRHRKPACAEELSVLGNGSITATVADDKAVNTR